MTAVHPSAIVHGSGEPVVTLQGVFARDEAGPRGATRGALLGATLALGPGVHAFVGAPEDGTIALCDVLAGVRPPLGGAVRIGGADPWRVPEARARIGALLAAPDLPEASSVRASVEMALVALGRPVSEALAILAALGLGALASRPTRALSYAEARAVELALAFGVAERARPPAVLVLFEPCADIAVPQTAGAVEERISACRAAGAVVILATSSPADARRLADETWVLVRGAVVRHERGGRALTAGDAEVIVTFHPDHGGALRAVAALVATHPHVTAALWEDPEPAPSPGLTGPRLPVLRAKGPDRDACALAVLDAAAEAGVPVLSITSPVGDLPAVRSAALVWFERARAAQLAALSPPGPAGQPPTAAARGGAGHEVAPGGVSPPADGSVLAAARGGAGHEVAPGGVSPPADGSVLAAARGGAGHEVAPGGVSPPADGPEGGSS